MKTDAPKIPSMARLCVALALLTPTLSAEGGADAQQGMGNRTFAPFWSAADAIGKGSKLVGNTLRDEVLRMRDFFDVTLPGIAARHHLLIDITPKVGDVVRREFVRFPVDVRYGLTVRYEIYAGLTPIVPNPFDSGIDHLWGPGMAKLGTRYDIPSGRFWFKRISVGFEVLQPLGNPPLDLIDQYMHLRPYVTVSRPVPWIPDTTLFLSTLYDRAVWAPGHDDVNPEAEKRHMIEVAPGLLYKPGQFGYFAQYSFRHWQEVEGYRLEHIGKVGVIWDMPLERSQRWHLPGKWQFELGLKASDIEGESPDFGVHARVKWRTDWFKRKVPKIEHSLP